MAGLVPGIHVLLRCASKTWMAATSAAMTLGEHAQTKTSTMRPLDPHAVKAMLADGQELALIDLREELIFSQQPSAVGALGAAEPAGAALRAPGAAAHDAHRARATTATVSPSARPRSWPRAGYTDVACLARRHCRLGEGRLRAVLRRQRAEQGVRRARRARERHAEHLGRRARRADAQRRRHRRARQPPVRRISHACRSRPRPTCPAPSWCCASTTSRRRPTRWWSSIAPAAPAASSARSR